MKNEKWGKIKYILQETLELEADRRQSYLVNLPDDERSEIESLLKYEDDAEDWTPLTAIELSRDSFDDDAPDKLIGQRIDIYEIIDELGQGGMGAVYLANRTDGKFEQTVAIKMLKREYNTERIRRSFTREKEILASLAHPNIAALIDAGRCADGVPYLVMEYVEGTPIDLFCRRRQLTLNERLKLFNRVCEAVAFAHRSLIVHRDLKPSNILVTEDGTPKLLDFGISKLLAAEPDGEQTATNLGAMTPQYASPEQIRGEAVTTATDVYSLGVVLFKILTDNYPYNYTNKTNGDFLKKITEAEPTLPSGALSVPPAAARSLIATEPRAAAGSDISSSQLKGDLDNIILKSLSKEPERRYATVEQFSTDIWRFIDGLPVLARPATFSYRAAKFYRRNKISVLAAVLILLSLVGGIAVAVSQAQAAQKQAQIASNAQRQAEIETEKAKSEEAKARKISDFMAKIIAYANSKWYAEGAQFGGEAKVIDALLEMSVRIDTELPEHADVRAELHHKFAEAISGYYSDGNFSPRELEDARVKVLFHKRRALALRREFYGERHELVAKDLAYIVWTLDREPAEQAKMMAEAIQMMRETNPNNLNLPYMLEFYANRLASPNGFEAKVELKYPYEEYHETFRQAAIPPTDENKYQLAERYWREALPVYRFHYKEDNYAIFLGECRLAYVLARQDKWTDFDEHFGICRQGETKLRDEAQLKGMRKFIERLERTLTEKKRLNLQ